MTKCKFCSIEIPKADGRGRQKSYCSESHRKQAADLRPKKSYPACSVESCELPAKRQGAGMCEAHYMRMRRNGSTDSRYERMPETAGHSHGYVRVKAKGHPRSLGASRAYAHRVAFTEANGEGPFSCYWCQKAVTWADMHVDHLNDDKQDNRPVNLVAACGVCNQQRGHHKVMAKHRAKTGISFAGRTLTIQEWADDIGISREALVFRLKNWPVERALTQGRGVTGPRPEKA